MSFFDELKRRNVFKVGVAYVIVAWLLIQIVATVFPILALPDWTVRFITIVIIIGFPIAIFLAWAYELTPEGIKPTQSVDPEESITKSTGQKLNYIIISLMALAIVFLVIDNYVLVEKGSVESVEKTKAQPVSKQTPPKEKATKLLNILPNSVAVLPFENMSPDKNNAYFAAGLHEEILNQLAKLKNLNVIARTTMLHYANTDEPTSQIASELKVKTVMEGSVRYAEGRVRVTAQLIDGREGVHIWSETYDRPFKDIFGIESDIAMNVANAMAVQFSVEEQSEIEKMPTTSPEAYALFLSATDQINQGTREGTKLALERIDRGLELDPESAFLWSLKASSYTYATVFYPGLRTEYLNTAAQAAQKALEINPSSPSPHVALGMIATNQGQWQRADDEFRKAVELGMPIFALEPMAVFQLNVGRIDEAYKNILKVRERDPLNNNVAGWELVLLDILGNTEAVVEKYHEGKELFKAWPIGQGAVYMSLLGSGNIRKAMDLALNTFPQPLKVTVLKDLDTPDKILIELHTFYVKNKSDLQTNSVYLAALAAHFADQRMASNILSENIVPLNTHFLWRSVFRETRKQAGFKELVRHLGLVDYWKEYGWPDLCKPVGEDDFECN